MPKKKLEKLISLLNRAAEIADHYDLLDSGGGQIGAMIGSIASDLEVAFSKKDGR